MIKERTKLHDKMMKKMHEIETFLVNELIAKRKTHFDSILYKLKDKRFTSIVNHIYHHNQEAINLKGNDAWEFVRKVKASNSAIENIQTDCLEDYKKEIDKVVGELL